MKTLVIGASPNPLRYATKAVKLLRSYQIEVVAIGKRETTIMDVEVMKDRIPLDGIHTVSLYVGAQNQHDYISYILSLRPKRIIFNPGTYNKTLDEIAKDAGIETVEDCTLVMLNTGSY